jgi:hypothetical protein
MPNDYRGDCPALAAAQSAEHAERFAPPSAKGQTENANVKVPKIGDNPQKTVKTRA